MPTTAAKMAVQTQALRIMSGERATIVSSDSISSEGSGIHFQDPQKFLRVVRFKIR
jgi:hypothetical protein